ncbi:MAG: Coenzyme F420 hydrogenase/dehydrogenase, beta subunit C-terminal domain, partial [Candidatus Thorarchaeota archaeon]|nr:Coenzyme F420 hydrogenase/dehydrogenase, beta subunit C-terminal domain [Candidatus Thorarchaeota archaeon]
SIASRSCSYCHDLTSTSADISCGNIGSEQGWTTVIIRTNEGKEAFEQALSMHLIEVMGVDHSSIQSIMNVARMKATRYYNLEPLH